jgi:hypothetical protein
MTRSNIAVTCVLDRMSAWSLKGANLSDGRLDQRRRIVVVIDRDAVSIPRQLKGNFFSDSPAGSGYQSCLALHSHLNQKDYGEEIIAEPRARVPAPHGRC